MLVLGQWLLALGDVTRHTKQTIAIRRANTAGIEPTPLGLYTFARFDNLLSVQDF